MKYIQKSKVFKHDNPYKVKKKRLNMEALSILSILLGGGGLSALAMGVFSIALFCFICMSIIEIYLASSTENKE